MLCFITFAYVPCCRGLLSALFPTSDTAKVVIFVNHTNGVVVIFVMATNITANVELNIRELMLHLGTENFSELARILGVTKHTVANWKKRNTYDVAKIESAIPNINRLWLLTGEGPMLKGGSTVAGDLPPIRKIVGDEVTAVPEDAYMMVEYADLRASAGVLGGNVVDMLPDTHRRLVPREYEKGYYLVVRVSGDSMNDGTDRSLSDGDEVLVKQVHYDNANGLPIRNSLFVITSKEGNVLKQIAEYNAKEGYMVCRSFNERYKDFRIELEDVFQIFQVCKVVSKQIRI